MHGENVNGVMLTLNIDGRTHSPNSRTFTITYKSKIKSSWWPRISFVFAVILNIFGLMFARISLVMVVATITGLSVLMLLWITHSIQSETVIVVPWLGIQSTRKFVLGQVDKFVPWHKIDDVVISEVIKNNRVICYLTILVKDGHEGIKLFTLFKHTKPKLAMLERIYCEMQNQLTEIKNARAASASGAGDVG